MFVPSLIRNPRCLLACFILCGVALLAALLFFSPVQGPVIAYKLALAVVAAIVGMAFDFLAFPYALPSGYTAYKKNFGGIGDTLRRWGRNITLVIKGVVAIFDSLKGSTFEIRGELAKDIKAAGLEDLVVNVGRMVFRIKEFFAGIWDKLNFDGAVSALTPAILKIGDLFNSVGELIGSVFGAEVKGAASEARGLGEIVGGVLSWGLEAVATVIANVVRGIEPVRFKETITIWTRREWIRHARSVTAEQASEQGESYVEEARGDHPCGVVPLVPFLFEETSLMTGLSATDDVLSLILKLYRNDSEMDKMLFDRAVPEKIITGLDEDKIEEYKTASYNCLFHPRVDGVKACYVEPQGMSFEALARQIEKDESAIREIALRMVRPQSAVGESAEAKQIDRKQLDTQLAMYARTCADAEARCWRLAAKWLNMDGDRIATPYQDKYDVEEAVSVLTDRLLALARESVISKATVLRSEAVKAVLPPDFDPQANARELREENENNGPAGGMWSLEAALRDGKQKRDGESAADKKA